MDTEMHRVLAEKVAGPAHEYVAPTTLVAQNCAVCPSQMLALAGEIEHGGLDFTVSVPAPMSTQPFPSVTVTVKVSVALVEKESVVDAVSPVVWTVPPPLFFQT